MVENIMSQVMNLFLTYQFIKRLATPFDETEAFRLGLIDAKGKRLKYATDVQKYKYYGHCYHSSQALFFLMDTDKLVPFSAVDFRDEKHWWLQDGNTIYDVTEDQYYLRSKVPPHSKGKKSVWYGWKQRPQQITLELMKRVLTDRLISDIIETY